MGQWEENLEHKNNSISNTNENKTFKFDITEVQLKLVNTFFRIFQKSISKEEKGALLQYTLIFQWRNQ